MQEPVVGPVVRIFDVYEQAQHAREALLAEGFSSDDVDMSIANDEAGPVAGNFTVGNMPMESDGHTYDRNYADVSHAAKCLVSVATADPAMAARADAVLARFGARAF